MDSVTDKFGRNYELTVETSTGEFVVINLPFTLEFDITRKTLGSSQVAQFRIYNLSATRRNQIRFNNYDFGHSYNYSVVLRAGYGLNLATIFRGNITQAWSMREGVDYITQIECLDGGFATANGQTSTQFPAGVTNQTVIETLAASLPATALGAIGAFPGVLSRAASFVGNTMNIISQLTGGASFIDNGKINILKNNEYIETPQTLIINAKTGLLGTPMMERTQTTHFDMIFEPSLNTATTVLIDSQTEDFFDGLYKVTGLKHRGMISAAVCGSVITTGEFYFDKLIKGVQSHS